jgi:hypothetical protein
VNCVSGNESIAQVLIDSHGVDWQLKCEFAEMVYGFATIWCGFAAAVWIDSYGVYIGDHGVYRQLC